MNKKITAFYGQECPYCVAIIPVVEKLEKEDGVEFEELEIWHNEKNKQRIKSLENLYEKECDGNFVVPSFYDAEGDRLICNPGSYENLKKWIYGS